MKKIKLILIFTIFLINSSNAGIYWNIEDGTDKFRKNDFKKAKEYLITYLNNNPNDKDGYWWLARTYQMLKEPDMAGKNFKKAYDIFTREKDINKINLSAAESENISDYIDIAKTYFDENNLKEAEYYADLILKTDSKSANAFFIKAKIAQLNKNEDLAKEYLKKAIIYNHAILKTNLAKQLKFFSIPDLTSEEYENFIYEAYFSGDVQKAIHYSKEYILFNKNQNKENAEIYNFLAYLYYLNNSMDLAKETLDEAKKIDKKNVKSYLLESKISKEKEEESLVKAYGFNPSNQDTLFLLGNYYAKKGDYPEALKYYSLLVNVNDNFYEGYVGYILCLIKNGEIEKAIKYIRKAFSLNPEQSELNILLAEICILDFKYKEALEYIEKAIKKDKNPVYYLKKAYVNYILKNYDESLADLSEAKKYFDLINDTTFQELTMMNYLKKEDYINLQNYLVSNENTIDKNLLTYKYNLYKLYKYNGDKKQEKLQYIKLFTTRPGSIADCLKLSEILLFEKGEDDALKFLDKCIKQNKNAKYELNHQKEKIKFIQTHK